jgi:hypothetical protein
MTIETPNIWWPKYQSRMRHLADGREGDLVDCYGAVRQIYLEELHIALDAWPMWSLVGTLAEDKCFLDDNFTSGFTAIEMGFEQPFDMVVIRRPMPVNGKMKRGWWHVGLVTRMGHVLHMDYGQGLIETPFRDTTLARMSATLRIDDVRLFRHALMLDWNAA